MPLGLETSLPTEPLGTARGPGTRQPQAASKPRTRVGSSKGRIDHRGDARRDRAACGTPALV